MSAIDKGKLVVISGPSGSGKTTIIERLRAHERVSVSVSVTTRPPREGERDGRDYHFVDRARFEQMLAEDAFVETNDVFTNGHLYGSTWAEVHRGLAHPDGVLIMEVDVVGAASLRAADLDPLSIFIAPPSDDELERRLRARGTETDAQIEERLARAAAEMQEARAAGVHIVLNDDIDEAVDRVHQLIGLDSAARS